MNVENPVGCSCNAPIAKEVYPSTEDNIINESVKTSATLPIDPVGSYK
ncbi:hypothetical protein ABIB50_003631 [Mucilaginibacter sp. UYCu711]